MLSDDPTPLFEMCGYPGDLVRITPVFPSDDTFYEGRIHAIYVGAPHEQPLAVRLQKDGRQLTVPWHAIEAVSVVERADSEEAPS